MVKLDRCGKGHLWAPNAELRLISVGQFRTAGGLVLLGGGTLGPQMSRRTDELSTSLLTAV